MYKLIFAVLICFCASCYYYYPETYSPGTYYQPYNTTPKYKKCTWCGGTGCSSKCFNCNGTGIVMKECIFCNGTGYCYGQKCYACGGRGFKNERCRFCNGTGCSVKCSHCHGTGTITE